MGEDGEESESSPNYEASLRTCRDLDDHFDIGQSIIMQFSTSSTENKDHDGHSKTKGAHGLLV